MPAPANTNEFLELVRKSGVLDEKRLDAHLQKLRDAGSLPTDPGKAAGMLVRDGLLTTFQAEQILQGKWRRFSIGKYKVLERLGSGGMGSVYLCEHKLMRRRVAVKVLPTAKAADPSSLERFYREARAVAALDHANIVHAYDIDQDDNLHFLVMEYVDGASLQEIVKRTGPMDPVRAAHYLRQSALGLAHAHERGLIHRDIKPGNLLVDRTGTVKVLDMGLARFFNDEEDILTKKYDDNVLGTADYLAPEQAVDSHEVDVRADIYSLGATCYFMLTGRTPFGEGTVAQKLIWHQSRQPKPVNAVRPDVPAALSAVIAKMMAKQPADRYQTPQEVADALAPWTQTSIPPPPEAEMPQLSLAAGGEASMGSTPVPPATPKSGSRKSWQVGPPPGGKPASNAPRAASEAAVASDVLPQGSSKVNTGPGSDASTRVSGPYRSAPTAAAAPATAPGEESVPWESLAEDTVAPLAGANTAPRSDRKGGRSTRTRLSASPVATQQERRRLFWVVLVVSGLIILGVALSVWLFVVSRKAAAPAERPPLEVSKDAGAYRSIQKALAHAKRGDRIVLRDERYEEHVTLNASKPGTVTEVTIEAAPGKRVVWTGKNPEEPLLWLYDAAGFHLRGQDITLDGEGRIQTLLRLNMHCPGLTIEGARLQGFTRNAIEVSNCAGDSEHPVRLANLDVKATAAGAECAIRFDAEPSFKTQPINDHIIVQTCHFEGFAREPIQVKNDRVNGDNVRLPPPGSPR
jgi:serine/threonine protein kinase